MTAQWVDAFMGENERGLFGTFTTEVWNKPQWVSFFNPAELPPVRWQGHERDKVGYKPKKA